MVLYQVSSIFCGFLCLFAFLGPGVVKHAIIFMECLINHDAIIPKHVVIFSNWQAFSTNCATLITWFSKVLEVVMELLLYVVSFSVFFWQWSK